MKTILYALLSAFRGPIFLICKFLTILGILGGIALLVFLEGSERWKALALVLVVNILMPQLFLIFYNRLVAWASGGTVILPE